jgi:uncharacterized membrane protein YvbJ
MAKFCTNCGSSLEEGDVVCTNCGTKVGAAEQVAAQPVYQNAPAQQKNGLAIAGFVVSLVSFVCCGSLAIIGLVLSIVGLVNSKKMNGEGKGLAIAGIILSSIGIVFGILMFFLGFFGSIIDTIESATILFNLL